MEHGARGWRVRDHVGKGVCAVLVAGAAVAGARAVGPPATMPDLSGLAWVEDGVFLGVHDAKRDDVEGGLPRVSVVRLPTSPGEGVTWRPLDVTFPDPAPASDLESASRIPGTDRYLLAESGDDGDTEGPRLFIATYADGGLEIVESAPWPMPVTNVEAIAVCRVGADLLFLYAERADGEPSTLLRYASFSDDPLAFGAFREVTVEVVDPLGEGARPIVALDVDREGRVLVVSAYDPDVDEGPFRSVVWEIGRVTSDGAGEPVVELSGPVRLATLDGLKVESVVVVEPIGGERRVYVGADDEDYGGLLRPLPRE